MSWRGASTSNVATSGLALVLALFLPWRPSGGGLFLGAAVRQTSSDTRAAPIPLPRSRRRDQLCCYRSRHRHRASSGFPNPSIVVVALGDDLHGLRKRRRSGDAGGLRVRSADGRMTISPGPWSGSADAVASCGMSGADRPPPHSGRGKRTTSDAADRPSPSPPNSVGVVTLRIPARCHAISRTRIEQSFRRRLRLSGGGAPSRPRRAARPASHVAARRRRPLSTTAPARRDRHASAHRGC
jgi:hypothetical protein